MDLHILPGVKAADVAEAHSKDLFIQNHHDCKCLTYWIDENRGNVFCLIEAPVKEAVEQMHSNAHGLIPNKIIEVNSALVESFLGRLNDPEDFILSENGLKVFSDSSMRVLMLINIQPIAQLISEFGKEKTKALLTQYKEIIKRNLEKFNGKEVEYERFTSIGSFVYAKNAVNCALEIVNEIETCNIASVGLKIAINVGEPVLKKEKIFGDTIEMAERMLFVAKGTQILISPQVNELITQYHFDKKGVKILSYASEQLLTLLLSILECKWQDEDFTVDDYCKSTNMSKAQLYRKAIHIADISPNELLKEFRLEKAIETMNQGQYNITEIAFHCGFSSSSYFAKCFKKKFNITPNTYLQNLKCFTEH